MVNFRSVIFLTLAASYGYAQDEETQSPMLAILKAKLTSATIASADSSLVPEAVTKEVNAALESIFARPELRHVFEYKFLSPPKDSDLCELSERASKSFKDIQVAKDFDDLKKKFPSANKFDFDKIVTVLENDFIFKTFASLIGKAKNKCPGKLEGALKDFKGFLDTFKSAPSKDEPKVDEPKADEPKAEAPKAEAPKAEEPKAEAPKAEEPKAEAPKAEAPKAEEPKAEAPKAEEPKAEAPKAEEPKADEPKAEEPKADEPKAVDSKAQEPKKEEPKKEESKKEEPKKEESKTKEQVQQSNGACSYGIHLVSVMSICALLTIF